jgi:hypothetical protein
MYSRGTATTIMNTVSSIYSLSKWAVQTKRHPLTALLRKAKAVLAKMFKNKHLLALRELGQQTLLRQQV